MTARHGAPPPARRSAEVYRVAVAAEGWVDLGALRDAAPAAASAASAASPAIRLTLAFRGELRLLALDDGEGRDILVTLRPAPDGIRTSGWGADNTATVVQELSRPLLAGVAADGAVRWLAFAPGTGALSRLLARSLLANLSVVRPEPGAPIESLLTWEVTEPAADGWRRVRYERDSATPGPALALRRTVMRFLGRDSSGDRSPAAALARVEVSGAQRVVLSPPHWRIDSIVGETSTRTFVADRQIGAATTTVSIGRRRAAAVDATESRAADRAAAALRRDGLRVGLYEPPARSSDSAAARRRLAGTDPDSLLGVLRSLDAVTADGPTVVDLVRKLAAYLYIAPRGVERLIGILDSLAALAPGYRTGTAALAATGTPSAQLALSQLLARVLDDPDRSGAVLGAAASVAAPEPVLVSAVESAAGGEGRTAAHARTVLGSFAGRLARPSPAESDRLVTVLERGLGLATTSTQRATWLDALGNAGTRGILPAVIPATRDTSALIRAHAIGALRLVDDSAARSALAGALDDTAAQVRGAAAQALGYRVLSDREVDRLLAAVRSEPVPANRLATLRTLWVARAGRPEIEAAVRQAADGDPAVAVRRAARAMLDAGGAPRY